MYFRGVQVIKGDGCVNGDQQGRSTGNRDYFISQQRNRDRVSVYNSSRRCIIPTWLRESADSPTKRSSIFHNARAKTGREQMEDAQYWADTGI